MRWAHHVRGDQELVRQGGGAILGIGGLGHLAIQYAHHMGFEVVAIGRGKEKAELAKNLGAHHYIDSAEASLGKALQAMGGATLVVSTASDGKSLAEAVKGLQPCGSLLALGATAEPLGSSANDLLFGSKSIVGSLTGDPAAGDATLRFSDFHRRRSDDRDDAALARFRSLRENDVGRCSLPDGSHDGVVTSSSSSGSDVRGKTMNSFQQLFEEQKALFASNVTRSRALRVDQLDRMGRMIKENKAV